MKASKAVTVALLVLLLCNSLDIGFIPKMSVPSVKATDPAWLSGWAGHRVKITLNHNLVNTTLSNFPVMIELGTSVGRNNEDTSFVFDELTSDANRFKIAITKSDGTTQQYVEIERWNDASESAFLWTKVPSLSSSVDTDIYLYYDATHADNTAYVGDADSAAGRNVWDDSFDSVWHLEESASTSKDSKGSEDLTWTATMSRVTGQVAGGHNYDGSTGYESNSSNSYALGSDFTIELWMDTDSTAQSSKYLLQQKAATTQNAVIYEYASDLVEFYAVGYTGSNPRTNMNITVADTNMHHIAFMKNSTSWEGYKDGVLIRSLTSSFTLASSASGFYLGASDTGNRYDGTLDEVRISTPARTADWIEVTYETMKDQLNDFGSEETQAYHTVTLNSPTSGTQIGFTVQFNYTVSFSDAIYNSTLFTNETGAWASRQNNASTIVNEAYNLFARTFAYTVGGTILWNVGVFNNTYQHFATSNATFVLNAPPNYQNANSNNSDCAVNGSISLYAQLYDATALDDAWLWTNETGGTGKNYSSSIFLEVLERDTANNPLSLPGYSLYDYGNVHPEVLYFASGEDGYKYWAYYEMNSAGNEADIYLARSNDGVSWVETGVSNPIIEEHPNHTISVYSHVVDPEVVKVGSTWFMWIGAGEPVYDIYLFTSSNGKTWTSYSDMPVIARGSGWESSRVTTNAVYYNSTESKFYCWYAGNDGTYWKIGLAESTNGYSWVKNSSSNPVLSPSVGWEGNDVVHNNVVYHSLSGLFYMNYLGASGGVIKIGVATSSNRITWTKSSYNPILSPTGTTWEPTYLYRASCLQDVYGNVVLGESSWLYYSGFNTTNTKYNIGIAKSYDRSRRLTDISGSWVWANFSWANYSISSGNTIQWRIYFNDTYGNQNSTSILTFTVGAPQSYERTASITLSLTTSIARTADLVKTLAQSLTLSSAIMRTLESARQVPSTIQIIQSLSRVAESAREATMQSVIGSSGLPTSALTRQATISVVATSSALRTISFARGLSASVGLLFSFSKGLGISQETHVSPNAEASRTIELSRTTSNLIAITHVVSAAFHGVRSVFQSIQASAQMQREISVSRSGTMSLSNLFGVVRAAANLRSTIISFNVFAQPVRLQEASRALASTLSMTFQDSRVLISSRSITQHVYLIVGASRIQDVARSASVVLASVPSAIRLTQISRSSVAIASVTLSTVKTTSFARVIIQGVTVAVESVRSHLIVRFLSQGISPFGSASRTSDFARSTAASLTLTLSPFRTALMSRSMLTDIALTFQSSRASSITRTVSNTILAISSLTRQVSMVRVTSQTLDASFTVARIVGNVRTGLAHVLPIATFQRTSATLRFGVLSLGITDTAERMLDAARNVVAVASPVFSTNRMAILSRSLLNTINIVTSGDRFGNVFWWNPSLTLQVSSSVGRVWVGTRTNIANIPVTLQFVRMFGGFRSVSTQIQSVFGTLKNMQFSRLASQTVMSVFSTSRSLSFSRQTSMFVQASSSVARATQILRNPLTNVLITSEPTRIVSNVRTQILLISSLASDARSLQSSRTALADILPSLSTSPATSFLRSLSLTVQETSNIDRTYMGVRSAVLPISTSSAIARLFQPTRNAVLNVLLTSEAIRSTLLSRTTLLNLQTVPDAIKTYWAVRTATLAISTTFASDVASGILYTRMANVVISVAPSLGRSQNLLRTSTFSTALSAFLSHGQTLFRTGDTSIQTMLVASRSFFTPSFEGGHIFTTETDLYTVTITETSAYTGVFQFFQNQYCFVTTVEVAPKHGWHGEVNVTQSIVTADGKVLNAISRTVTLLNQDPAVIRETQTITLFWDAIGNEKLYYVLDCPDAHEIRVVLNPFQALWEFKPYSPYAAVVVGIVAVWAVIGRNRIRRKKKT